MRGISDSHGVMAISFYLLLLTIHLSWRREWVWLAFLACSVPGGMLLNETIKHLFQRTRPSLDQALEVLPSYSFPSGHVTGATLFYGVLAVMLMAKTRNWGSRTLAGGVALSLVALVALSRLYLGVHYLSDVLAAFAEAVAWLSLCLLGLQRYRCAI
jgi:undecaprenyl-diphosphatase